MTSLTYKKLSEAVSGSACAFRARTKLQPADGPGGKVFPPTHLDGKYATELRVLPEFNEPVPCVLLDSVQSHANRCEEALQLAVDRQQVSLPLVVVDFSGAELIDPVDRITSLEAPHRLSDAILRDSELDGVPFRKTELGHRLDFASLKNATPLLDLSPHSLLFGLWDSTGPKGGLGVKFQRCLVGEIVGCNVQVGTKTSSRIDPLGIVRTAEVVVENNEWRPANAKDKGAKKPSEINHGNIPPEIADGGVTFSYAQYSMTLSLPAIRRLRFPVDGEFSVAKDNAGRTLVAALGLLAVALATESGFNLRSRCLLWPETALEFELLGKPGESPQSFSLDSASAVAIYNDAVSEVRKAGFPWRTEPIVLKPSAKLIQLVQTSQKKVTEDKAEAV
jgi:CRISPR-associated protein Csb1